MTNQEIKIKLFSKCKDYISSHRERINMALSGIKNSLNDEGKSTVGDKHHTNRAMLQLERENLSHQIVEVEKQEAILNKISLEHLNEIAHLGSLVVTDHANYFMSVSAGAIKIEGKTYYCVSLESPIGKLMLGRKLGEVAVFNDKKINILEIH
ncbi:MAG: GreA/GreB family elongation factor [Bacteroidia bacterium]|nr:GreA/GreB family elongation factor [Bacteroidia bacterium]NNF31451.1 3-oxoacyl-ACP synthase [Flavobacteriaceae bacterium]MBT8275526.1 GreA/GreB family elongation factor [Bacteroidia bacterium]NNJ82074.1 3-oxoacyl-ACP synthase [Flavobacteriaceae bacterium]NNK54030.1 3-oxoacyl-ACP synthase [Flavobacteriaceae bacterium]